MQSLLEIVNSFTINEEAGKRGRPKKNKDDQEPTSVSIDGKVKPLSDIEKIAKKVEKKPADENGCEGAQWAVDEPTSDADKDLGLQYLPKDLISNNIRKLYRKFQHNDPFFIMGKAGWGKTSLIKKVAYNFGYKVITVYLDKAEATDLAGIPIVEKGKRSPVTTYSLPPWAGYIYDHPEDKFLLFFDEMNQAAPDVMNALMPIVLEKRVAGVTLDNILVGAAGNLMEENDSLSELSKPLESRFKPIIEWEVHTKAAWRDAFQFLHKQYDKVLGKGTMQVLEDAAVLFANPREVELKLIKPIIEDLKAVKEGKFVISDAEDWVTDIEKLLGEDIDPDSDNTKAEINHLAEYIAKVVNSEEDDDEDDERESFSKQNLGIGAVDENIESFLKFAMSVGSVEVSVPADMKDEIPYDHLQILFTKKDVEDILTKVCETRTQAENLIKRWEKNHFEAKYNDPSVDIQRRDRDAISFEDLSMYGKDTASKFMKFIIDIDSVDKLESSISTEEYSNYKKFIKETK